MKTRKNWLYMIAVVFWLTGLPCSTLSAATDISGRWVLNGEELHNYQYRIWTNYDYDGSVVDVTEEEFRDEDLLGWGHWGSWGYAAESDGRIEGYFHGFDMCGRTTICNFTGTISDGNKVELRLAVPARSGFCGMDFHTHTEENAVFEGTYDEINNIISGTWNDYRERFYLRGWCEEEEPPYYCTSIEWLHDFACGNFEITIIPEGVVSFWDKKAPSHQVTGATTDGATEVIIKIWPLPEGTTIDNVQISLPNGEEDGYLGDDKAIVEKAFTQTYVAPDRFVRDDRPEDLTNSHRVIELLITLNGEYVDHAPFKLVRPPVIMVHGLWSNFTAFSKLSSELNKNGFIFLYGPSYKNSASLAENSRVLPHLINNVLTLVRVQAYACAKVDIVAHSMGGLLSKLIPHSFAQEKVRKIITIGTPYEGSPWANFLWWVKDELLGSILEEVLCTFLPVQPPAIKGGAIEDLRTDPCNTTLPVPTQIPGVDCRTVVVGEGLYAASLPTWTQFFLCLMTGQYSTELLHTAIFGPNTKSDWIVSEASQRHDAPDPCAIPVLWHCTETDDVNFTDIVLESLNQPAQISLMASLIKPSTRTREISHDSRQSQVIPLVFGLSGEGEPNGTVEIVEPNEGQIVMVGSTVTISVEGMGDTNEAIVFASFGTESYANLVDLPWQDEVNVPLNSIGTKAKIIAVGLDPNRNVTDMDKVNLVLDSNILLQEIFFGFGDKFYFDFTIDPCQPHQLQLYPLGRFSDGSEHTLEVLTETTGYQSLNECVATVDPNGLITIHSKGSATIRVSNSGQTTTLLVEVDTYTGDLNLDGAVNFLDFAIFANRWRDVLCSYVDLCGGTDLNMTTDVTCADLAIFADNWLKGAETAR